MTYVDPMAIVTEDESTQFSRQQSDDCREEGEIPDDGADSDNEAYPSSAYIKPTMPMESLPAIPEEPEDGDDHPDPLTWKPEDSTSGDDDDDHPDPLTWEPEVEKKEDDVMFSLPEFDLDSAYDPTLEPMDNLSVDPGLIMYNELGSGDFPEPQSGRPSTRDELLANIPLLRQKLSFQDSIVVALYALGSGELADVRRWFEDNAFFTILNLSGRFSGVANAELKGQHATHPDFHLLKRKPGSARGFRFSLTKVGLAHAEAILGSSLAHVDFRVIQHLPLGSRLRYILARYGAQRISEYSSLLISNKLNLCSGRNNPAGSLMSQRSIISGISNLCFGKNGSLFAVDNFVMNRTAAARQWSDRFVGQKLESLGMTVLEPVLFFFGDGDYECKLTLQLVPQKHLDNFVQRVDEVQRDNSGQSVTSSHYVAKVGMPEGTLIPAYALESRGKARTPLGKFRASFALCEFNRVPGFAGQYFYMAKSAVNPGDYLHLSGELQTQPEPVPVKRLLSAREKCNLAAAAYRAALGIDPKAARLQKQQFQRKTKDLPLDAPKKARSRTAPPKSTDNAPKRRRRGPVETTEAEIADFMSQVPNLLEIV
jgi:hypothetical protein